MGNRRIPQDAFFFYVGLGPARSYQQVADKYGVTKRAVVNLAVKERWQEQVGEMERKARQSATDKAQETLEEMSERHLKMLRAVQGKALEALRTFPLETASAAARALDASIKQERVIRGEPGDRTATSVEDTIRREYERWMTVAEEDEGEDEEDETHPDAVSG